MDDLRYPIGRFERPATTTPADRAARIEAIVAAPAAVRAAVAGLDDTRLDTPYRDGGWTVRQVIHHLPDSHLNAYLRCKLALTEDEPTIKTYEEQLWAELPEAAHGAVDLSLDLLAALHRRWVAALHAMTPEQFDRTLRHPVLGPMTIDQLLALYAWHGRHHVAHIRGLRERRGW